MKIQCEKCHAEYEVSPSMFGKSVECQCGNTFVIPAPRISEPKLKSPPESKPSGPLDENISSDAFSVCMPLHLNSSWIRIFAGLLIAYGVISTLLTLLMLLPKLFSQHPDGSVFSIGLGLATAWMPLVAGTKISAAMALISKSYKEKSNPKSLTESMEKLAASFNFLAGYIILTVCIVVLAMLIGYYSR